MQEYSGMFFMHTGQWRWLSLHVVYCCALTLCHSTYVLYYSWISATSWFAVRSPRLAAGYRSWVGGVRSSVCLHSDLICGGQHCTMYLFMLVPCRGTAGDVMLLQMTRHVLR